MAPKPGQLKLNPIKAPFQSWVVGALMLRCTVAVVRAQIVSDGATNTLSNTTTNITGNVIVGTNGSFTLLVISDNAFLTNSANGVIGLNATAKSNEVRLLSPTSRWQMGSSLFVGSNGSASRLVVSNGALVENFNGILANNAASSNNFALVTGSSTWSNRGDLSVGFFGGQSQLIVSNGSRLVDRFAYIGRQIGSSNNLARVTGSGSFWTNSFSLFVGFNDRSNRLVIDSGALVISSDGLFGGSSSANDNDGLVTGSGSLWSNLTSLIIGDVGVRNRLIVSNGATVWSDSGLVGNLSPAVSNQVIITGAGSLWTNQSSLTVGGSSPGNRADVSNGGRLACSNGVVGQDISANNNTVLLADAGTVWTNVANLFVGNNGSGNLLIASNGAGVFLGGDGVVGVSSNSIANAAIVTGSGSIWKMNSDLFVGSNSPFNRLLVTNGGSVIVSHLVYAGQLSAANSNTITVTGPGSSLTNHDYFFVGESGAANQLIVSNGAAVLAGGGFTGIGLNGSASNNVALVTGPNSRLQFSLDFGSRLDLGRFGRSNQLIVANGGKVSGPDLTLIGFDSLNNLALVTGSNSAWTDVATLSVGQSGPANRLIVSNGATASVLTNLIVGEFPSSTNNRVAVDNSALFVTNASGTGTLDVRRGTNLFNAGLIEVDQLLVTNKLGWIEFNGGTLITRSTLITNGSAFLMGISGSTPAVWDVRAGVTNHVITDYLDVGFNVSSCQLLVTNGASLSNAFGTIGVSAGIKSNTATISGIGSRWEVGGELDVGFGGSFDGLIVSNGGLVISSNLFMSTGSSASNNLLTISDPGSALSNRATIYVGYSGGSNQVTVSNGGFISNSLVQLGFQPESSNNLATIAGQGSLWTNSGDFYLGVSGAGNRLVVTNGGILRDSNGLLGANASSSNNLALITGSGSLWSNRNELHVGDRSAGNQLVVSNGGTVFAAAESIIGDGSAGNSNSVVVTDAGSAWFGTDGLFVGNSGSFNRLVVSNGGLMAITAEVSLVGSSSSGNSNQVLVTGTGSTWSNQFDLFAGDAGSGNTVVISNAAASKARMGLIGNATGAKSNSVIVTQPGSSWVLLSTLQVGNGGAFNRAVVANGALMVSSNAFIGFTASGSNNEALVSGTNSFWSNRVELNLGQSGGGNRLTVTNGGRVSSSFGFVGLTASSRSNIAMVTGAGSLWVVSNSLTVGFGGDQNRMIVNDGGAVRSGFGTLNTRSNEVVITNAGASWRVDSLEVGSLGVGNRLVVSEGGRLDTLVASLGSQPAASSSNNEVIVTGPGASWTNLGDLFVGRFASANRLVVSNGGFCVSTRFSIGDQISSSNNRVIVDGGTLRATNGSTALLDIRRGTNVLNAGLIDVNLLLLTNTLGFFEFNGGTLRTAATTNNNGRVFKVGNGISPATLQLQGGAHVFASNLLLASNATLNGNGTIIGELTAGSGSVLAPGTSVGKLILSNSPTLQGTTVMEIQKSGSALTNDQIQVAGPLTYGGSLVVTNIGTNALSVGDRYLLFNASSFAGSFSSITLPPLPSGLIWTNKLAVDGSLEVTLPSVTLAIQQSNNVLRLSWPTNASSYCLETAFDVTPPVLWQPVTGGIVTNASSFLFSLTNTLGTPKQFFRLAFPCASAPGPSLFIQLSNNLITLSWPSNAFRLETAFNLLPPISWQTLSNGISNNGSLHAFTLTNNPAIPNQFFRLAFP